MVEAVGVNDEVAVGEGVHVQVGVVVAVGVLDGVGVSTPAVEGPSTTGVIASGRSEVVATAAWTGLLVAGAYVGVLPGAKDWPIVGDGAAIITAGRVERAVAIGKLGRAVGSRLGTSTVGMATVASVSKVAAGAAGMEVKKRLRKRG